MSAILAETLRILKIHDVDSGSKPAVAMAQDNTDCRGRDFAVAGIFPNTGSDLPVSAIQYAKQFDDADAAERRLFLCLEICLWLHALFAAVFAAAILGAHL